MTRSTASALAVALLALLLAGCGVTASSRNPGYVEFDPSAYPGLERDTAISIGPTVLRFAAGHADEDPAAEALLRGLEGVRVQVYRIDEAADLGAIARDFERSDDFAEAQWQRIVRVVDDDSRAFVFIKHSETAILGLAILAVDGEELVFVNVMGELDTTALAALSRTIPDEPALALRHAPLN